MTSTQRYKSPNRKEMSALCAGRRVRKPVHRMRGNVPKAVEEDKTFFELFQLSKHREQALEELKSERSPDIAAVRAAQNAFNAAVNAVRARWFELVPEDRPQ